MDCPHDSTLFLARLTQFPSFLECSEAFSVFPGLGLCMVKDPLALSRSRVISKKCPRCVRYNTDAGFREWQFCRGGVKCVLWSRDAKSLLSSARGRKFGLQNLVLDLVFLVLDLVFLVFLAVTCNSPFDRIQTRSLLRTTITW